MILTGEDELAGHSRARFVVVAQKGNVTLLERPVRVATLTTVIRSGLRARQRQLDVKANLERAASVGALAAGKRECVCARRCSRRRIR